MATLAQIRTRIRQRSDHEHTGEELVTDLEINQLINKSRLELFGLLVHSGLHSVPETEFTIISDGSETYALPEDFYAVQGVFRNDNGYFYRLIRHSSADKPHRDVRAHAFSYRIYGYMTDAVIEFIPRTSSTVTDNYVVRYIAAPAELTLDTDVVDGVLGWEEYIVVDVVIDILMKEGLDPEYFMAKKGQLLARIRREASDRDLLETHQVRNTRNSLSDSLFDDQGRLPGGNRGVAPYYWRF